MEKSRRRSSILKSKSPSRNALATIEPCDGERVSKLRRVSFAETNEIKEFITITEPDVVFNLDGDLVIKPPEDCLLSYDNVEKNYLIVSDLQYEKITQLAGSNEVTSCQESVREGEALVNSTAKQSSVPTQLNDKLSNLDCQTYVNTSLNKLIGRQTVNDPSCCDSQENSNQVVKWVSEPEASVRPSELFDTTMFEDCLGISESSVSKDNNDLETQVDVQNFLLPGKILVPCYKEEIRAIDVLVADNCKERKSTVSNNVVNTLGNHTSTDSKLKNEINPSACATSNTDNKNLFSVSCYTCNDMEISSCDITYSAKDKTRLFEDSVEEASLLETNIEDNKENMNFLLPANSVACGNSNVCSADILAKLCGKSTAEDKSQTQVQKQSATTGVKNIKLFGESIARSDKFNNDKDDFPSPCVFDKTNVISTSMEISCMGENDSYTDIDLKTTKIFDNENMCLDKTVRDQTRFSDSVMEVTQLADCTLTSSPVVECKSLSSEPCTAKCIEDVASSCIKDVSSRKPRRSSIMEICNLSDSSIECVTHNSPANRVNSAQGCSNVIHPATNVKFDVTVSHGSDGDKCLSAVSILSKLGDCGDSKLIQQPSAISIQSNEKKNPTNFDIVVKEHLSSTQSSMNMKFDPSVSHSLNDNQQLPALTMPSNSTQSTMNVKFDTAVYGSSNDNQLPALTTPSNSMQSTIDVKFDTAISRSLNDNQQLSALTILSKLGENCEGNKLMQQSSAYSSDFKQESSRTDAKITHTALDIKDAQITSSRSDPYLSASSLLSKLENSNLHTQNHKNGINITNDEVIEKRKAHCSVLMDVCNSPDSGNNDNEIIFTHQTVPETIALYSDTQACHSFNGQNKPSIQNVKQNDESTPVVPVTTQSSAPNIGAICSNQSKHFDSTHNSHKLADQNFTNNILQQEHQPEGLQSLNFQSKLWHKIVLAIPNKNTTINSENVTSKIPASILNTAIKNPLTNVINKSNDILTTQEARSVNLNNFNQLSTTSATVAETDRNPSNTVVVRSVGFQPRITSISRPRLSNFPFSNVFSAPNQKRYLPKFEESKAATNIENLRDMSPTKKSRYDEKEHDVQCVRAEQMQDLHDVEEIAERVEDQCNADKSAEKIEKIEDMSLPSIADSQLIDSTLFEDSQMKDDINVAELPNEQIKDNEIIKQACDASMDISCAKAKEEVVVDAFVPTSVEDLMNSFELLEIEKPITSLHNHQQQSVLHPVTMKAQIPVYEWAIEQLATLNSECDSHISAMEALLLEKVKEKFIPKLLNAPSKLENQSHMKNLWILCKQQVESDFSLWTSKLAAARSDSLKSEKAILEKLLKGVQQETELIKRKRQALKQEVARLVLKKDRESVANLEHDLAVQEQAVKELDDKVQLQRKMEENCKDLNARLTMLKKLYPCSIELFNANMARFSFMDSKLYLEVKFTEKSITSTTFHRKVIKHKFTNCFMTTIELLFQQKVAEWSFTQTPQMCQLVQRVTKLSATADNLLKELCFISKRHLLYVEEPIRITVAFSHVMAVIKFDVTFSCTLESSEEAVLDTVSVLFGDIRDDDIRRCVELIPAGKTYIMRSVAALDKLIEEHVSSLATS